MHNSEYVGPRGAAQIQGRERRERRAKRLKALGYRSYDAYLRSEHWAAIKRRYYTSDQPQDCICGETTRLQLHHLTYEAIGEERLSDLRPLCASCHGTVHGLEAGGAITLGLLPALSDPERAERYAVEVRKAVKRKRAQDRSVIAAEKATAKATPIDQRIANIRKAAKAENVDVRSMLRGVRLMRERGRSPEAIYSVISELEHRVYRWKKNENERRPKRRGAPPGKDPQSSL